MSEPAQAPAQKPIGDFAPKLVSLTDDILFGDVWERPELYKRDRSLITVGALVAGGNTEQLAGHLRRARENGLSEAGLSEAMVHLAFSQIAHVRVNLCQVMPKSHMFMAGLSPRRLAAGRVS